MLPLNHVDQYCRAYFKGTIHHTRRTRICGLTNQARRPAAAARPRMRDVRVERQVSPHTRTEHVRETCIFT